MSDNRNWAKVYAPDKVKGWRLPATEVMRPQDGVFSKLHLKWSELPQDKSIDLYTICADVLVLDQAATVKRSTYLFARRIEVMPGCGLTLDRTKDPNGLLIAAKETVAADSGLPQDLTVKVLDAGGASSAAYSSPRVADGENAAVRVIDWEDNAAPKTYAINELDGDFLLEGEALRVHLRCIFQLAVLLSTEDADLSIRQLNWVAALATASEDTRIMGGEARALATNLIAMANQENNALLVPDLDYSVYANSAQAFLDLLNRRQAKQDALEASIAEGKRWLAAAEDALARNVSDEALNDKLLAKAKATREQALNARSIVARKIALQRIVLFGCERDFKAGVEIWKIDKIIDDIFKIITGIVEILAAIPTMVVAGPSMGMSSVMSIATTTVNLAIKAGTTFGAGMTNAPLSVSAGAGATDLWENTKDYADAKNWDKDNPPVLSWSQLGGDGPPEIPPPYTEVDNFFEDLDPNNGPVEEQIADYNRIRNEALAQTRLTGKELAAQRKAAQAKFEAGVKQVGDGAGKIMDAAADIASTIKKAEKLEKAGNDALLASNEAVDTAFSSVDLQGLDVVTGGKQVWENLVLAVDKLFERTPELSQIQGGDAYRTEMRRLLMLGKTFAQTRLAVAKANGELAEMIMRKASSDRNVAIYKTRVAQLGEAAAYDNTIAQLAFGKILDAKRAVYLAMESYRRAFMYFTLVEASHAPQLPKFTDPVDRFNEVGAIIAGTRLANESLKAIGEAPQTIPPNSYFIPAPNLPRLLFQQGGMSIQINTDNSFFTGMGRIRLNRVRVFAEGLDTTDNVMVRIATSGHYQDKAKDGSSPEFVSTPRQMTFIYSGSDPKTIRQDGDIARRYEDDFFHPTPFTNWGIHISSQSGAELDFKTITGLRIEFSGESSSI